MNRNFYLLPLLFIFLKSTAFAESNSAPSDSLHSKKTLPDNVNSAIKLAGLVTFVGNACPSLKPDYDKFKTIISNLGVDENEISKNDMKMKYLSYTSIYQQDIKGNCERAYSMFGDSGTTLKGLFHRLQ